ncbi:MAG: Crp/Fnr family transcriptional regulator [Elusimicrobiales bacterium]
MWFGKKDIPECDACPSKTRCLYASLDRLAQREWKGLLSSSVFADGDLVFSEGDKPPGLFLVCKGRVKICKTSANGQQLISRVEESGGMMGHIAMLAGGNFQANGEVMGEAVVSLVEYAAFIGFLVRHPNAALSFMRTMAREVRDGESKARDIAYKSARARLAGVLIKSLPSVGPKTVVKDVKRRELAEMAGLTVETAVRILADFEKKKIIRRDGKEIAVISREMLDKIAAS